MSNSSSSSFVIARYCLSQREVDQIVDHIQVSKDIEYDDPEYGWCNNEGDAWEITMEDDKVHGYTFMDNFDMRCFLRKIGVSNVDIVWSD